MSQRIKDGLLEFVLIIFSVIAVVVVLSLVIFVSFKYFDGWAILGALAAQLAFLMVLFHLLRWWQYPGIYESYSAAHLVRNVVLSILLMWSLPIIAILARLHLTGLLPLKTLGSDLGLEFKFHKRKKIRISGVAPTPFRPGEIGVVRKMRVISSSDFLSTPLPLGTVIYKVAFYDGVSIEIPEPEIVEEL